MREQLLAATTSGGGAIARSTALSVVPAHVLEDALKAGAMVRLLPSVYGLGGARLDRNAWRRAALLFVPGSVLSHLDGLDLWG